MVEFYSYVPVSVLSCFKILKFSIVFFFVSQMVCSLKLDLDPYKISKKPARSFSQVCKKLLKLANDIKYF